MALSSPLDPRTRKRAIRTQMRSIRPDPPQREERSARIWEKLLSLAEYQRAGTVMIYVDMPGEVRTQPYLPDVRRQGKQVVVPYCDGEELGLFLLESSAELTPGTLGILEPSGALRALPAKQAEVSSLDLLVVPGVAFDRQGARLGHGKGYYDRLLRRVRSDALVAGVAFECQLVSDLPMLAHDVYMDKVITEEAVYRGKGRGAEAG